MSLSKQLLGAGVVAGECGKRGTPKVVTVPMGSSSFYSPEAGENNGPASSS